MNLAFTTQVLERASRDQIDALIDAVKEGTDELRARVEQCKEHDARNGENALVIQRIYSRESGLLAFLDRFQTAAIADLSAQNALDSLRA
jgi:hypothetical protein